MTVQYVPETMCPGCETPDPIMEFVDLGIGAYEYGGAAGFHRDEHWLTRCCEANPVPFNNNNEGSN